MDTLLQDVRYGIRMVAKSPGFAAIAILTLALGIGANTALFSVVNGVLLNPLPYRDSGRLVAIYAKSKEFNHGSISYPNFLDWVRSQRSFSAIAAFRQENYNLIGMGDPERLKGDMVSAEFFPVLGVNPVAGRQLLPDDDRIGAQPVALISAGFWQRKFASAPDAVGKTITLDGASYTIVGIIPTDFRYQSGNFQVSDVYVPIGQWADTTFRDRRTGMGMDAVGRLKAGVTLQQAQADMNAITQGLSQTYPDADKGSGVTLLSLKDDVVGDVQPFLLVLLAAVGFVLLIACVNVANLLLARSTGRTREFAIRAALGAGRTRVIRQLLTESLTLAIAGGALGLLLAAWGTQSALKLMPDTLPATQSIHIDSRVLLFTLTASLLSGILFGLAPALKTSRASLQATLQEGARGSSARRRLQGLFVVIEMAMALVLLIGASLMIRSLSNLWSVDPGFNPSHLVTFAVSYPPPPDASPDAVRAALRRLQDTVASVPGVQAASLSFGSMPMAGDSDVPFWIDGEPKPATDSEMKTTLLYLVEPDYLKAMSIPLQRGRFITSADNEHAPMSAVIDEEFARLHFPGRNPIGHHLNMGVINQTAEIVGVTGHVKQWGLTEDAHSPIRAQMYVSVPQIPAQFMPLFARGGLFVVRFQAPIESEMTAIRRALQKLNSQLVLYETQPMEKIIADSLAARRFSMILLGIFAALAMVLSCIGIYGVVSYLAGQRTHEIGIRMALGAQRDDVLRLVLGHGAAMSLLGVALGIAASLALTPLMAKLLFGVSPHDPLTYLTVPGLLIAVALAASYIPARRAMRVDPIIALRYD